MGVAFSGDNTNAKGQHVTKLPVEKRKKTKKKKQIQELFFSSLILRRRKCKVQVY
jgi:hypothetical protein